MSLYHFSGYRKVRDLYDSSDKKNTSPLKYIYHYMPDPGDFLARQVTLIGCCGAYCGKCPALNDSTCKGCKLGYDNGKRDINAARCSMKRCCLMEKKVNTCADCPDYGECRIIQAFFAKNGYKYRKYWSSLEFIRKYGYPAFLTAACSWKRAYGNLEPPV